MLRFLIINVKILTCFRYFLHEFSNKQNYKIRNNKISVKALFFNNVYFRDLGILYVNI